MAASDLEAQGAHAARLVKDLEQGQAVILARTTRVLSEIALGLAQAGVRFFGPERIKRRSGEPAVLLSYLRALGAPGQARPEDVNTIFRIPNRFLPDDAEDNVASALRAGQTFTAAVGRLRVREDWRRPKLAEAARLFDVLTQVSGAPELIYRLRTEGGLDRHYADAEQLSPIDKSAVDWLAHAEDTAAGMSVVEFAGALDYRANIIEQHFDPKGIELATIHGAKGRQWPLVILAGAQEGELPHARSLENADDPGGELEGERRLAYVAFTRAQHDLLLMYDAGRPSRFIREAALAVEAEPAVPPEPALLAPSTPRLAARAPAGAPATRRRSGPLLSSPATRPPSPREPVELVPESKRGRDGSIPCSLPGCSGTVLGGYVREVAGGYAGLCPNYRLHHDLIAGNPKYDDMWVELSAQNQQARSERRAAQGESLGGLLDGTTRCSLPGCAGIVKPEFQFAIDGVDSGLCGQRSLHHVLARRDSGVSLVLQRLEDAKRAAWREGSHGGLRRDLLLEGGIPCSVLGCDGIVGRGFIIATDAGEVGICGLSAEHERLTAEDPEVRRGYERLHALELERRRSWSSSNGVSPGGKLDNPCDFPF